MKDSLGDRMKANYENRTRICLPRRTYTIVRVDGKAFHTYTRKMTKPYDDRLIDAMNHAAAALAGEMMGCQFCYLQSDEISFLLSDFHKDATEAWFDGNLQKMVSVSASIYTAYFNSWPGLSSFGPAFFDARAFTIPDPTEVANYFIWRQQDASRNSVNAVARTFYSHKELENKNCNEMQEMIFQKGINWDEFDVSLKRGRIIHDQRVMHPGDELGSSNWYVDNTIPIFTQDKNYLSYLIPKYE